MFTRQSLDMKTKKGKENDNKRTSRPQTKNPEVGKQGKNIIWRSPSTRQGFWKEINVELPLLIIGELTTEAHYWPRTNDDANLL